MVVPYLRGIDTKLKHKNLPFFFLCKVVPYLRGIDTYCTIKYKLQLPSCFIQHVVPYLRGIDTFLLPNEFRYFFLLYRT